MFLTLLWWMLNLCVFIHAFSSFIVFMSRFLKENEFDLSRFAKPIVLYTLSIGKFESRIVFYWLRVRWTIFFLSIFSNFGDILHIGSVVPQINRSIQTKEGFSPVIKDQFGSSSTFWTHHFLTDRIKFIFQRIKLIYLFFKISSNNLACPEFKIFLVIFLISLIVYEKRWMFQSVFVHKKAFFDNKITISYQLVCFILLIKC